MTVNYDASQEVVNGPETFAEIAMILQEGRAVIIGWTDQRSTHHDILFTLRPTQYGLLQSGMRGSTDIFVSIMRKACFGFDVYARDALHHNYIAEKLREHPDSPTVMALAELITGVRDALQPPRTDQEDSA